MSLDGFVFSTNTLPAAAETCTSEVLAERKRIAQELHDTVLQGFFSVSMQLHAAVTHLPEDLAVRPRFGDLLDLMDRVIEQGRRAVENLHTHDEYLPPLGESLAAVPADLGLPAAGAFRVVIEGRQRGLRATVRDEVYRIGREAIFNAYRHAQAEKIETAVSYRSGELRLSVRDNGCGIDLEQLASAKKGHWGLRGMRERAERIGARLRILSRAELGTEVELCVPGVIAFDQNERARNFSTLTNVMAAGSRG